MPVIGIELAYFCRRSTRPRLVFGHFGAAKSADLGQDAGGIGPVVGGGGAGRGPTRA